MIGSGAEEMDADQKSAIKLKEMEIFKPKRKYPGFRKNLKYYLQEFTDYTGIHGFKYMGEQDRSVFERLWWIFLFCISLYVCIDQIFKTWMKWDASPVLVSFARSPTPVWQIPFPAITICSETKTRQRKYNFTDAYSKFIRQDNMTDEELWKVTNPKNHVKNPRSISYGIKCIQYLISEILGKLWHYRLLKKFSDSSLICDNHLYTRGEKYTELKTIDYLMSTPIRPRARFIQVNILCRIGGKDLKECSRRLLKKVLDDTFAAEYSLHGYKKKFKNTKICTCVLDAIQRCHKNITLKEIEVGFCLLGKIYRQTEDAKIAPQFEDVFFTCKWTLVNESCENLFTTMLTEDGLCFTFNMLERSELFRSRVFLQEKYMAHGRNTEGWTLEDGYPRSARMDTFPRRALSAGFAAGFNLVLMSWQPDLDYVCRGPVQGFKILLHHPAEIPRVGNQYFRAALNQEVVVSVKPDMMTTSPGLRDYDAHRRQCFFPTERYLAFYQSYTQQNCQVECLTNFTLARCGCVAYHMPHEKSTRICGPGNQECMFQAQTELLVRETESGISNYESEGTGSSADCDCLPSCTSLTYNAEYSQGKYEWQKLFQAFRVNFSEFPGVQMTRLSIFFKEQQFITSERNELYGQTDFLANCGGILGLFTGFSVLSIIEIIYFLSLRLMCNVRRHGRRYWSGSARLVNNDAYVHD